MTDKTVIKFNYDELAERLRTEHEALFSTYSKRALGSYIGNINRRAHLEWWRKRPEHVHALAAMLGLDEEDLGLDSPSEPHFFHFPAFPSLPPLDLRWERPAQLGKAAPAESARDAYDDQAITLQAWAKRPVFLGTADEAPEIDWLHIEDALEFELMLAQQRQHRPQEVLRLASLDAFTAKDEDTLRLSRQLLLFVDRPIADAELQLLRNLRSKQSTRIISRHAGENLEQIKRWRYRLTDGWRQQLIEWIAERVRGKKTLLQAKDALALLREQDPYARLLLTTVDIYDLCHLAHTGAARPLSRSAGGKSPSSHAAELLESPNERSIYARLVRERWLNQETSWNSPMTAAQWQALAPGLDISALLADGRLIHAEGGYALGQPTGQLLLLCDLSAKHIRANMEIWQLSCYDVTRHSIIDAALDRLSFAELCNCARALVAGPLLGRLAPAVKLFLAIAPHLAAHRPPTRSIATLSALASLVVGQIAADPASISPWSRPVGNSTELLEWIAACWAWSTLPTPAKLPITPRWLFPGWSTQALAFPEQVARSIYQIDGGEREHAALDRMRQLAPGLLNRDVTDEELSACPPVVRLCALSLCAGRTLPAEFAWAWWHGIVGKSRMEELLLSSVNAPVKNNAEAAPPAQVAASWWPSLIGYMCKRQEGFPYSNRFGAASWFTYDPDDSFHSPVLSWVLTQMEHRPDEALAQLSPEHTRFLLDHPKSLAPALGNALLRKARTDGLIHQQMGGLTIQRLGPSCAPELPPFIDGSQLGGSAAQALWAWDPERAKQMFSGGQNHSDAALRQLIFATPAMHLSAAAQALRKRPELLADTERTDWARRNLPYAGHNAPDLLPFLGSE